MLSRVILCGCLKILLWKLKAIVIFIEASCKIELDKLIASRFMLFFKDQSQEWQKCLTQSLAFFLQVESRVGVQLDYSLLQKFLGHNFDFSKLTVLSM